MRILSALSAIALLFTPLATQAAAPNVALGRPTSQTSINGAFTPDLAVNGNLTDFTHTVAGVNTPSTWEVNLTNTYAIERIVLNNRTSCCQSRLRDITVRITDVNGLVTNWTSALLNPENVLAGPAALTLDLVALTGGPIIGGRVRVTRTPDPDNSGNGGTGNADEADVLSLGEVEVNGTPAQLQFVPLVSSWKYLADGSDPGASWMTTNFNDAAWSAGNAELGYGDGDENTTVGFGGNPASKHITTYFRKSFVATNQTSFSNILLRLIYDDGAVVYLNGTEVQRVNMPVGAVNSTTPALTDAEFTPSLLLLPTNALVFGTNTIAVEVHQGAANTDDLSFALEMTGAAAPTIALTNPLNGQNIYGPIAVTLAAQAADPDGAVVSVQFYQGTNNLGSDTSAPFALNTPKLTEGSYTFSAVATDSSGLTVTSAPVSITILDTNPPAILSVFATSNTVAVTFSRNVVAPGAVTAGNYQLDNGAVVSNAAPGVSSNLIVLETSTLGFGTNYVLTVNSVQDTGGRTIATNSTITFNLLNFTAGDVGNPSLGGSSAITGLDGFDVTGAGSDIGGVADQFQFEARLYTGDFDVKVRLQSLSNADAWTEAGLMARESLAPGSRFAAAFATPTISGCFFQYRDALDTAGFPSGTFPSAYPNLWLRLRRVGNAFTGFAGMDGSNWQQLGTVTNLPLPATVSVGMVVSSHVTNTLATAQFREFMDVTGNPSGTTLTLPREPLGPSSRATPLVITEIMYHPDLVSGLERGEFIELFNAGSIDENIGSYRLSGAVDFTFPTNTILKAGAFLVIAREPGFLSLQHPGLTQVLGPFTGTLPNDAGTIRLRNPAGAVLLDINYRGGQPWPIGADGGNRPLVLHRPSYGEGNPVAWTAGESGGTPGRAEAFVTNPLQNVVINEFLAHSTPPLEDFVELYNHSNAGLDLSGAWLSDDAGTNKFRIPDGTTIPARGFVSFGETQLGFALGATGERILLVGTNGSTVIDAIEFDDQGRDISSGRSPDGAPDWFPLAARTAGTNNSAPARSDLVINEIMFNPISGDSDDEFVEIYNRGTNTVNLAGWKLGDGISFTFPTGASIASGGYVVVAKNAANLLAHYPGTLSGANTYGDYGGTLANGGERITLSRPEEIITTNLSLVVSTTRLDVVVNEVTYGDGGRWSTWADGGGSSLELIDPDSDNRRAANWADSDETAKSTWSNIEYTWQMGESLGTPINDNVQLALLGVGECLVDDVEVRTVAAPAVNCVGANSGFESGLTGWTLQGSHDQSSIENSGYSSAKSLHLRAGSRGDNGANRVRSPVLSPTPSGPVTLRAKARWLRGWPELLVRLHGGTLEASGRFAVPLNLGTPGAANSRAVPNAGPAIFDVAHSPVLPAANDPVLVTARAIDPDGVGSLTLRYRIDPSPTFASLAMLDDGTGGDAVAGDGLFTATVPPQASGSMVAFYVDGLDGLGATGQFPKDLFPTSAVRCFPNDSLARECLVRWGEVQMFGTFATYHLWLSSNTVSRWTTRDSLNNAAMDGTFIYNNHRVVYNAGPLFSGSPFHAGNMTTGPAGASRCDYIVQLPDDDRVMGSGDFNLNLPGNSNGNTTTHDLSAQAEQTSYLMFKELRLQFWNRRYIHLFVNGTQRNTVSSLTGNFIYEDSQQPNGDVMAEWFPDDAEGELVKIEDWFEFNDAATSFSNNDGDLTRRIVNWNGTNALNFAPYRFMWRKRGLSAGDSANDYTNFLTLLDAVSPTTVNTAPIDSVRFGTVADWEQWMREIACEKTVGNFDAYGYDRGKNNYLYFPRNGRVVLIPWDIDWTLGTGSGRGPTDGLFGSSDPRMVAAYAVPEIRRAFLRAFKNIVDGPLNNAYIDPIMDAKAAAFTQNNINYSAATVSTIKSYILNRRNYILTQLSGLTNAFAMNTPVSYSTNNTVVTITGYAPVDVKDIAINGALFPVTWAANYTTWTVRVALTNATNVLVVQGLDAYGQPLPSARTTNTVQYTGPAPDSIASVVINEILFHAGVPGTEFIELFNTSSNTTFDLAGWQLNGLGYTFPGGSLMLPRTYLVLAKDRILFNNTYGTNVIVFDEFPGDFQNDGETLSLLAPGGVVVDRVRYEGALPWPAAQADGTGSSYQLLDAAQDNSRAGNWFANYVPPVVIPEVITPGGPRDGWRFVSLTGTISATNQAQRLVLYIGDPMASNSTVSALIDDFSLVVGTNAAVGQNFIRNGDFESPLDPVPVTNSWLFGTNYTNSLIVGDLVHTGTGALKIIGTSGGTIGFGNNVSKAISQWIDPVPYDRTNTLSFWYWATNSATNVFTRILGSAGLTANPTNINIFITPSNYVPPTILSPATNYLTPGVVNQGVTNLAPFPLVWINEVQAENTAGPLDNQGEREPWLELYNSSTNPIPLEGLFLTHAYTNLTNWVFPPGASLGPTQFLVVICDGEPGETAGAEYHTSFRLPAVTGGVALSRLHSNSVQVIDYVNYAGLHGGRSYGSLPDGQSFDRQEFFYVTPGGTNDGRSAPLTVFLNEWMAQNGTTLADPADGQFEDWFEIYNPGPNTVDLAGYYLTDVLTNKTKFLITTNMAHLIPPGGHLLVWADNEEGQNLVLGVPRPDLHVNFALSAGGEALGIYAADGTQIDALIFGAQVADVSQGRYPDGTANLTAMPGTATPRAANQLAGAANTAPVLGAIGTKVLFLGQSLAFTATATDGDVPAQALTFSLAGTPPGGAQITAGGAFTWTPAAVGTNSVTVRVSDNGVPVLSDEETITVEVLAAPSFTSTVRSGDTVELTWPTRAGQRYAVDGKLDLNAPAWTPLWTNLAAGDWLSYTNATTNAPQQFFRIRTVP